ncbi:hypothetical protein B0H16DRAFT_1743908 [Mycena metata]|uniref:Uncharacterized protein n=1 Tax=Mycena metata TaxID=1033252 RepID=A0AAD7MDY3_9AGAR|nr:hypothetical protein B0H16DRAFT_1743908 [Mycena metata]
MDVDKKPPNGGPRTFAEDDEVDYGDQDDDRDRRGCSDAKTKTSLVNNEANDCARSSGGEAQDERGLSLDECMQRLTIECTVAKDRKENVRRELRDLRAEVRRATDVSLKMVDAARRMRQELDQRKDEVHHLEVLNNKRQDVVRDRDCEVYELQEQLERMTVEDINTRSSGTTNSSGGHARRTRSLSNASTVEKKPSAPNHSAAKVIQVTTGRTSLAAATLKPISFRPEPKHMKAMYAYVVPPQVQLHPVDERGFPTTAAGFHWHNQLQQQQKVVHERTVVQQLACTDYRIHAPHSCTEVGWDPALVAEIFQHKEFIERGCAFADPYWTSDDRLVEATHGKNALPSTQSETSDRLVIETQIMGVLGTSGLYASRVAELDLKIAPWMELTRRYLYSVCKDGSAHCTRWTTEKVNEHLQRSNGVPLNLPRLRPRAPCIPWKRACDNAVAFRSSEWESPGVAPIPRSANSQIALLIANGKARPVEDNDTIRWNNPFVPCADKAAKCANAVAKHQMQSRRPGTIPHIMSRGCFASQSAAALHIPPASTTTPHNEEDVPMPPPSTD